MVVFTLQYFTLLNVVWGIFLINCESSFGKKDIISTLESAKQTKKMA